MSDLRLLAVCLAIPLAGCFPAKQPEKEQSTESSEATAPPPVVAEPDPSNLEKATLAGGCFWCTEAVMEMLEGVVEVKSGYTGGHLENPTYDEVAAKTTGHAEAIEVTFDRTRISYAEILDVFWQAHDPTTINRQGADVGPQYRSAIFFHSPNQKNEAEASRQKLNESKAYSSPAVTEITKAGKFWEAETEHQDFYQQKQDDHPYCKMVISPKLKKLGLE